MDPEDGAFALQALAKLDGRTQPHVVGILFKSQAQHPDAFVFQDPKCFGDLFEEPLHLIGVDALHFA